MLSLTAELERVVRASPFEIVGGNLYVYQTGKAPLSGAFATIDDGIETTVVVREAMVAGLPAMATTQGPFRAIRLRVSVPFDAPGFLAYACGLLATAGCSVLVISTYTFDYVLVRSHQIDEAKGALSRGGFPMPSVSQGTD